MRWCRILSNFYSTPPLGCFVSAQVGELATQTRAVLNLLGQLIRLLACHCQALTSAQPCADSALMLSWLALFVVEHTETYVQRSKCLAISCLHFHVLQFPVLHFHVLLFCPPFSCPAIPCLSFCHFQRPRSQSCISSVLPSFPGTETVLDLH